jgi:hypothetical protein
MIYKFRVWSWKPMTTEIYLAASEDDEALNTFKKLNKDDFVWKIDSMRDERVTYEVIKNAQMEPTQDTENTEPRTKP